MAEVRKVQVRDGGIVAFVGTDVKGLERGVLFTLGQAKFWRDEMDRAIQLLEDAYELRRQREATELRQKQQQKKQELLAITEKLRALGIEDETSPPPVDLAAFSRNTGSILREVGAQ